MKKLLMAAVAVFMMSGSAVVAKDVVEIKNNATLVQDGDVIDKMVALLKYYTEKINAAETLDELAAVSEEFSNEVKKFSENHEEEIMKLATVLTEQQRIVNTVKLETAMAELEAATEKKIEELTPEPLVIDKRIPPPPLSSSDEVVVSFQDMSDYADVEALGDYEFIEEYEDVQIIDVIEEQPEFPGGMQALSNFLSNNIRYPRISRDNGSQGRAFVGFTVNSDGSIQDIEIMKSTGDMYLDREALRLVESMPKWSPGRQSGKPVRVKFVLPVNFHLQDNPKPSSAKR